MKKTHILRFTSSLVNAVVLHFVSVGANDLLNFVQIFERILQRGRIPESEVFLVGQITIAYNPQLKIPVCTYLKN